jgi:hypothetical protein
MDLCKIGLEDMDYIHLAENRELWRAVVWLQFSRSFTPSDNNQKDHKYSVLLYYSFKIYNT